MSLMPLLYTARTALPAISRSFWAGIIKPFLSVYAFNGVGNEWSMAMVNIDSFAAFVAF